MTKEQELKVERTEKIIIFYVLYVKKMGPAVTFYIHINGKGSLQTSQEIYQIFLTSL